MEDFEKKDFKTTDTVFSKSVKAGKRTYFFDVKTTRQNEHYITITESKKIFEDNGSSRYEKHKIFLYKEDFDKFMDSFFDALNYIKDHETNPLQDYAHHEDSRFTDVDFDEFK